MRRMLPALALLLLVPGCGRASRTPASVTLSIVAPTDGATVGVSSIYALGSVRPASASVLLDGRPVHVSGGAFRGRVVLRRGLNHVQIVATAKGYAAADERVAVRSEPVRESSDGASGAAFRESVNELCNELIGDAGALVFTTFQRFIAFSERVDHEVDAVKPPPGQAGTWAAYLATSDSERGVFREVLRALRAHDLPRARALAADTLGMQRTDVSLARRMGLNNCAPTFPAL